MNRAIALAATLMLIASPAMAGLRPVAMPAPGLLGLAALGVVGAILIARRKR